MRRRARQFNPSITDFRGAIYWLWKRGVPRLVIGEVFRKSVNLVSVSAYNEDLARGERVHFVSLPERPDFSLAENEFWASTPTRSTSETVHEVQSAESSFWSSVRFLEGVPIYGELLQRLSRPGEDNIAALRLRAKLKQLTAENYLHAGYVKSAAHFAREAIELHLQIYKETWSKIDLFNYAKASMILSLACIQREEWANAIGTLKLAEEAFAVSGTPIDPELYRQRASILFQQNKDQDARRLFLKAFSAFPAHRDALGYGWEEYARHDVGLRPLAYLTGDFELALKNMAVASAWPAGDIHHAINLNATIATAFLSDTSEATRFINDRMAEAIAASAGFGHQSTIIRLLELTPSIPIEHRRAWVRFSLHYNAYRNR